MSLKTELEKKIEKKSQEIQALAAQIQVLEVQMKEGKAYIQGLQEALRMVPKDEAEIQKQAEIQLRPGSDMAKAREVLKKAGKPLYIVDILKAIGKEPSQNNIKSVSGSMNNYIRDGKFFTRPKPNTYGLIEFKSTTPIDEPTEEELPDDFGLDTEEPEVEVIDGIPFAR